MVQVHADAQCVQDEGRLVAGDREVECRLRYKGGLSIFAGRPIRFVLVSRLRVWINGLVTVVRTRFPWYFRFVLYDR